MEGLELEGMGGIGLILLLLGGLVGFLFLRGKPKKIVPPKPDPLPDHTASERHEKTIRDEADRKADKIIASMDRDADDSKPGLDDLWNEWNP